MDWKVEKKMPISINDQVAHCGRMWPTPSQRDYKGANGDAHFQSRDRPHLSQLPNAVKMVEIFGLLLPYAEITTAKGQANGAETD
jgi:hypothetical protein